MLCCYRGGECYKGLLKFTVCVSSGVVRVVKWDINKHEDAVIERKVLHGGEPDRGRSSSRNMRLRLRSRVDNKCHFMFSR